MSGSTSLPPIRVAPGGRYFETFAGEPFLFIGCNDAISWPGLNGLFRRKDIDSVERYLAGLAGSGVTVLRLMLEYVHREGRYFERPFGKFNSGMVRLWDDLFTLCGKYGLRILLAPWDNFWMAYRFHRHPYNARNGGPAAEPASFFTDRAVIEATKNRLRFVVERWGGSGVLAAWDLFNEIHPYWGGTVRQQMDVISQVSEAVREAEMKAWGFTRPQTVSIFGPGPSEEYEELIFRHPSLDFATTHIYEGAIDHPNETVTPALLMSKWVRHALERIPANRPYTDTEHGPIHLFNDHRKYLPEPFDDEYERHLMWAHLATGGAGSGMRWPARHPHVITSGMRQSLLHLAAFTGLLEWRHFSPRPLEPSVSASGEVHAFACADERQAIVWLLRAAPPGHRGPLPVRSPLTGLWLTIPEIGAGPYCVRPFETATGRCLPGIPVAAGENGALQIPLPPLHADLALAIRRGRECG